MRRRKLATRLAVATLGLFVVATLILTRSGPAGNPVTPALAGHWSGDAKIIVSWCRQDRLPVAIHIAADGVVTGKVGDAELVGATIAHNRGWLGQKLGVRTDLIIRGGLGGAIVAAESITRKGVNIPLNFESGDLVGGLHSTGNEFGGKPSMKLTASPLIMEKRVQPVSP